MTALPSLRGSFELLLVLMTDAAEAEPIDNGDNSALMRCEHEASLASWFTWLVWARPTTPPHTS